MWKLSFPEPDLDKLKEKETDATNPADAASQWPIFVHLESSFLFFKQDLCSWLPQSESESHVAWLVPGSQTTLVLYTLSQWHDLGLKDQQPS